MSNSKNGRNRYKYIQKDSDTGLWVISKTINGKKYYFGEYKTLMQAKVKLKEIKKIGFAKYLGSKYNYKSKNYYKTKNGKYIVFKIINGEKKYYGQYNTETDAKKRVDQLRDNEWKKICY